MRCIRTKEDIVRFARRQAAKADKELAALRAALHEDPQNAMRYSTKAFGATGWLCVAAQAESALTDPNSKATPETLLEWLEDGLRNAASRNADHLPVTSTMVDRSITSARAELIRFMLGKTLD